MNIALEQTEEYVNGQLKNKYGDAFIRGNNGNILSLYGCVTSKISYFVYNQDPQQIFYIIQKFSFSFALFIFNFLYLGSSSWPVFLRCLLEF